MKKKKCIFLIILIVMILLMIFFINNYCYAEDFGLGTLSKYKGSNPNPKTLTTRVGKILGIIQIIGVVLSVAMLIVIGIKYMLGSVEEKAEYKETLKPYIIGAFIVFTGTLVPQVIYKFMQNF